MLEIGTKVKVVDENVTHNASIGDTGTVVNYVGHMFIVEFDMPVRNGALLQMLEEHEIEVVS